MDIDYTQFKTPFFRIKIGGAKARNPHKFPQDWYAFPQQMIKLVESIEIYEALFTPEYDDFAKIVIKLIDGSREPFPVGSIANSGNLFSQLGNKSGLSNNSSALLDMTFQQVGINFDTAVYPSNPIAIEYSEDGKIKTETVIVPTAPKYLFQERNKVEITWGYITERGKPHIKRTATGYVAIVQSEFPENGSPKVTLTCQVRPFIDQLNPISPQNFGIEINQNHVVNVKNTHITNIITNIATKFGLDSQHIILSPSLSINDIEQDLQVTWPSSESLDQFLKRLATWNYAYYDWILHPIDKKPVLIFIKKADFESQIVVGGKNLLNYKAPGSIIKSISFKADFAVNGSNMQVIVDQDGNLGKIASATSAEQQALSYSNYVKKENAQLTAASKKVGIITSSTHNTPEQFLSFDPVNGTNPIDFCQAIDNSIGGHTNRIEFHAGRSETQVAEALSSVRSAATSNAIQFELNTLGYPFLTPGLVHIGGIGLRYSGKYRILTVSHIIDSNGYNCKAQAVSHALSKGGISVLDTAEKASGIEPDPNQASVGTAANVMAQYLALTKQSLA